MEISTKTKFLPRKTFRKIWKKQRRKQKRQERARNEVEILENDPNYQLELKSDDALLLCQIEREAEESRFQNELWMAAELQAQEKFAQQQRELEAIERIRDEEKLKATELRRQKLARIETNIIRDLKLQQQIEDFLNGSTTIPDELLKNAESNPGRDTCTYFQRTSSCRYGDPCIKNHIRPGISKILMIGNFFDHIRLSQAASYTDIDLEFEDKELDEAFAEFFFDACYELEKFGTIERFFVCQNPMAHLRGKGFIEYSDMREALSAWKGLNGRFYGGRQLSVEFSGVQAWSEAICGCYFVYTRCSHGSNCNLLHCFKNPRGKYSIHPLDLKMEHKRLLKQKDSARSDRRLSEWDKLDLSSTRRDWRWSESPENTSPNTEKEEKPKRSERSRKRPRSSPQKKARSRSRSTPQKKAKKNKNHKK